MEVSEDENKSRSMSLYVLILFLLFTFSILFINRSQSYIYYERIQFKSAGDKLYANLYYPSKDLDFQDKHPLIIYCHGIGAQRDIDLRIPIELTKRGFFVAEMAGGSFGHGGVAKERAEQYKGRVTAYVIVSCIVAAVGGSLFGYDIGISGSSSIFQFSHSQSQI